METTLIAEQLGVKILKRLRGAEVLDAIDAEDLKGNVFLVEKDGQKMVLKTGNFNKNEVADNQKLSSLGIRTHKVLDSKSGEYILYEYLDAPLLAQKDYWSDENLERVIALHQQIRDGLASQQPTDADIKEAEDRLWERINTKWLPILVPNVLTADIAERIKKFYQERKDIWGKIALIYRDNNAEHYVDLSDQLAVLDVDLIFGPKEYMNMRYLCWVLFKSPQEHIGDPAVWAQKWTEYLKATPEHYATWLLSLIGILWDIYGNENSKGQQIEKTENIKKLLAFVMDKLGI
ncbi:MAG: hypothetical protein WC805_01950 [Patescibacteria group bacterium]|jgi:hypothetical protein